MNAVERLVATLQGKPADRIPVNCNLIDQGARELGLSPKDYFADGERVAEGQLRLREKYGYDAVWSLFYVGREAEYLGCKGMVWYDEGPPNVGHMVLKTLADEVNLVVPDDVGQHPAFEQEGRCIRMMAREVGGRQPILAYLTSSITLPIMLLGMEKWLPALLEPESPHRDALIEKCHRFFVSEVKAFRAAGVNVVVYANPFATTEFLPLHVIRKLVLPWVEKDLAAIGTDDVVFAGVGRLVPTLPDLMERTKVGAWYLSQQEDLAAAKQIIGSKGLACGVINDIKMISWTPAQVRDEVKRLLKLGMPGEHFLFGSLVMPLDIPEDNIRAMVDTAIEYGRWPPPS